MDKYPSIFSCQMEAVGFINLQMFIATHSFENWEISLGYPSVLAGALVQFRDAFKPIARERKYLMDYSPH